MQRLQLGVDRAQLLPNGLFIASSIVVPNAAGEAATLMPADFIASILASAVPLPPEMMAPACPIRLPGGAVTPAMNPATGFL